ncbi:hypothetical protein EXN66_Car014186 [Channa argus]|uniref:Uncharacterized protein n=1 Tax=Channa argus TaxID=215402 RepID=A0A6G1Q7H4_CHAAH|nr:hypothetical protein EXN66_Car014186 [Channa argus]
MLPVDSMSLLGQMHFGISSLLPFWPHSLNMDAVDDMYFGCNKAMTQRVKSRYFKKENNGMFKEVLEKSR